MKVYCFCCFYKGTEQSVGACRVEDLGKGRKTSDGSIGVKEQISNSLGNIYSTAVRALLRKE